MRLYPSMGSNQIRNACLLLMIGASALLTACSSVHDISRTAPSRSPPVATGAPTHAATVSRAMPAAPTTSSSESSGPIIRASAPMTYTVKPGDTLWGIAAKFLRNPWDWPEVWYINPRIHNPHWIYPGDVLALAYGKNGKPMIRVVRPSPLRTQERTVVLTPHLRSTAITAAIPTIPYSAVAPFLSRPVVFTTGQIERAPHVIAIRDQNQVAGSGFVIYVSRLGRHPHRRYSVIHVGHALRAPGFWGFGHVYGYLGEFTGTAVITADGDPATAVLTDSARETFPGDRLITNDPPLPLHMAPRAPARPIHGQIISVLGGTGGQEDMAGTYDIVVVDRGSRAGLVPGDVLAVDHRGRVVHDPYGAFAWLFHALGSSGALLEPRVKLPNYRIATLLVFKTYRHVAFALVVAASHTINDGDVVGNP